MVAPRCYAWVFQPTGILEKGSWNSILESSVKSNVEYKLSWNWMKRFEVANLGYTFPLSRETGGNIYVVPVLRMVRPQLMKSGKSMFVDKLVVNTGLSNIIIIIIRMFDDIHENYRRKQKFEIEYWLVIIWMFIIFAGWIDCADFIYSDYLFHHLHVTFILKD